MDGNPEKNQVEVIAAEEEKNLIILSWHEDIWIIFCSTHADWRICHEDHQSRMARHRNKLPKVSAREYFLCAFLRAHTHHPSILPGRSRWERRGIWRGCNSVVKEMDLRRWNGRDLNPPVKEETQE